MENDKFGLSGKLKLELIRAGEKSIYETPNTVVTIGKSQIAGLMTPGVDVGSTFTHMSIGLGSSTVAAGDDLLGSEYMKAENTGTRTTTAVTNDTAQFIGSFGIKDSKTINEAGLFNQSGLDLGSMFSRTGFANIVAISGDAINATWTVQVS